MNHVTSIGRAPGILHIPYLAWDETIKNKLLQTDTIDGMSCVCKAREMIICKRHIRAENYQPRWRVRAS